MSNFNFFLHPVEQILIKYQKYANDMLISSQLLNPWCKNL